MGQQKYEATWESLKQYTIPDWYQDAKVWYFYPLGCLCGSRFWQRVVSTRICTFREQPEFQHHIEKLRASY